MKEIMTLSEINKFKIKTYAQFAQKSYDAFGNFDFKKYRKLKRMFLKNTKFVKLNNEDRKKRCTSN